MTHEQTAQMIHAWLVASTPQLADVQVTFNPRCKHDYEVRRSRGGTRVETRLTPMRSTWHEVYPRLHSATVLVRRELTSASELRG